MTKPKSLSSPKYPEFIRNNSFLKSSKIRKDFISLGLKDFSIPYTHKCKFILKDFINILNKFASEYFKIYPDITFHISRVMGGSVGYIDANKTQIQLLSDCSSLISIKDQKIILPLRLKLNNGAKDQFYPKNSSLLSFINGIINHLQDIEYDYSSTNLEILLGDLYTYLEELMQTGASIELSLYSKLRVVFSTHPWDIATMSMRGIKSCQSWDKTHSQSLVGSILDPYAGIIYITDGTQHSSKLGTKMLARSIVRAEFPYSKSSGAPLYKYEKMSDKEKLVKLTTLENAYVSYAKRRVNTTFYNDIFQSVLSRKQKFTNSLLVKKIASEIDKYSCAIPLSKEIEKLPERYHSYRDSGKIYLKQPNKTQLKSSILSIR